MQELGGWEKDNDYVEYKLIVPKEMPEKYMKVAQMIEKRYDLHVRAMTRREIFKDGYGHKVFEVINETFKHLYGYSELSDRQIDQYVKMYLPFVDLNWDSTIDTIIGTYFLLFLLVFFHSHLQQNNEVSF